MELMLGADHLIPGGGYGFFVKKKIVQQILENTCGKKIVCS